MTCFLGMMLFVLSMGLSVHGSSGDIQQTDGQGWLNREIGVVINTALADKMLGGGNTNHLCCSSDTQTIDNRYWLNSEIEVAVDAALAKTMLGYVQENINHLLDCLVVYEAHARANIHMQCEEDLSRVFVDTQESIAFYAPLDVHKQFQRSNFVIDERTELSAAFALMPNARAKALRVFSSLKKYNK